MTESSEQEGGFDRRSLIKKGLIVGGAAAVVPVISTFNTPAFAASPPPTAGVFRVQLGIVISLANVLNLVGASVVASDEHPSSSTGCTEFNTRWNATGVTDAPLGSVTGASIVALQVGHALTFTTGGGCTFVSAIKSGLLDKCEPGVPNGNTISFPLKEINVDLLETAYFLITCPN